MARPVPKTLQQRKANAKFYKDQMNKMGKPKAKEEAGMPISTGWFVLIAFLVIGGGLLELSKLFF
ncbi:hypothetical protein DASC09_016770 [Saccharomycopsis crataegensis]|uniref:Stress-associated endoplasmic reticulum protein n=1 Tax=Saccharomycopsis crataegensis TaxID=43959 RepID=A0AAV5QIE1_9ASCO|nr:hypothetical protein DASC09_016770 [Saccharomycopsis crataegensis]